jgi:ribonuclease P protein component
MQFRLACIVDLKVSKRSLDRNKVKRRIRAIVRALQPQGVDVVVRAKPSAVHASYLQLQADIQHCVQSKTV